MTIRYVISRVVGVPGDRVEMKDGNLYLNGRQQSRTSLFDVANYELRITGKRIESRYPGVNNWAVLNQYANAYPRPTRWEKPDRVPDGFYVLLGDARNDSPDSHVFGLVPAQAIKGKVIEKL